MRGETTLILGSADDEHAAAVMHALQRRGRDAEYLDSRWFPGAMTVSLDPGSGADLANWTSYRFGEPSVTLLPDGSCLLFFWYMDDANSGIRFARPVRDDPKGTRGCVRPHRKNTRVAATKSGASTATDQAM